MVFSVQRGTSAEKGGVMVRNQGGVGRERERVDSSRGWTTTSDGDGGDSDTFSMLEAAESSPSLWERMLEELPRAEPRSARGGSPGESGGRTHVVMSR